MEKLGFNVWWYVPEVVTSREDIQNLLSENGFDGEAMKMPTKRAEVSRAARALQNRKGKSNRRVTEKAKDNSEKVVYGILDRGQTDEEIDFHQTTKVTYDKSDQRVHVTGELSEDFMKAYNGMRNKVTHIELRNFAKAVVRMCAGIPKRPSGGFYFVPDRFEDTLRNAQAVVDGLKCGAKLYIEKAWNDLEERQNLWNAVEHEVHGRVRQTLAAAEKISSRASSLHTKKAQIHELENLTQLYQDLLGDEAEYEDMLECLSDATSDIEDKLVRLSEELKDRPKRTVNRRNQWQEFGLKVLFKSDKPLHYREIAEKAIEMGLQTNSQTPEIQMGSTMGEAAKNGFIQRTSKGVYSL